jgi:methenyltetrahydrofolate cyclohydrolase
MSLIAGSVRDLLTAFSSSDPTPGGGSAAALASAIGAALLTMVAGLPKTRSGSEGDRQALTAAIRSLTGIREQLTAAVEEDTRAYDQVVEAYRLAKDTEEEKAARKAAIQRTLRGAIDVPLQVMRLSALALDEAQAVAAHGHRGASSDVGVAVGLLRCGLRSARLNVDVNLTSVHDEVYTSAVAAEVNRLSDAATESANAAEAALARG